MAARQRVRADKGLVVDFTHCSNTGLSHRAYSAEQKPGAQAERSAAGKHTKYQGRLYPDPYQVIPIAVESFGAMAAQTHEASRALRSTCQRSQVELGEQVSV